MNRRGFLNAMLRASAAAMVLPAAVTYARHWVKPASIFIPLTSPIDLSACGSITRCTIQHLTPAQLEEIFRGGETFAHQMDELFRQSPNVAKFA